MIPKISLYNFFTYKNNAADLALFSLIAQCGDFYENQSLSVEELERFRIQRELFWLIDSMQHTLDSYGTVNFFAEYSEEVKKLPRLCELLTLYFGEIIMIKRTIKSIDKSISFYETHLQDFKILKIYDHPQYDEIYDRLNSERNFGFSFYDIISTIFSELTDKISKICVDKENQPIDPEYTGQIKDGSRRIYTLKDGYFFGECITFFEDSTSIKKIELYNYSDRILVKEWHTPAQLAFEIIGYSSKIENIQDLPKDTQFWYPNGNLNIQNINNKFSYWDENGNSISKEEYTNLLDTFHK